MEVSEPSKARATFQYRPQYNDSFYKMNPTPAQMCYPSQNIKLSCAKFEDIGMYTTHYANLSEVKPAGYNFEKTPFLTYDLAPTDPNLRALIKSDAYKKWSKNEVARSSKAHWLTRDQRRKTIGGLYSFVQRPFNK